MPFFSYYSHNESTHLFYSSESSLYQLVLVSSVSISFPSERPARRPAPPPALLRAPRGQVYDNLNLNLFDSASRRDIRRGWGGGRGVSRAPPPATRQQRVPQESHQWATSSPCRRCPLPPPPPPPRTPRPSLERGTRGHRTRPGIEARGSTRCGNQHGHGRALARCTL